MACSAGRGWAAEFSICRVGKDPSIFVKVVFLSDPKNKNIVIYMMFFCALTLVFLCIYIYIFVPRIDYIRM